MNEFVHLLPGYRMNGECSPLIGNDGLRAQAYLSGGLG